MHAKTFSHLKQQGAVLNPLREEVRTNFQVEPRALRTSMSGDDGTPECITSLTASQAVLEATFAASDSPRVEAGQLTAVEACLTAMPPAVTGLPGDECDATSSNVVIPCTTELRELTPSEASLLLNESDDGTGAEVAKAILPLRPCSDDPSAQPTKWADQPSVDTRHIGPAVNIDAVQAQIRAMRLANPDGVVAPSTKRIAPAPWPISSYVMLRRRDHMLVLQRPVQH